MCELLLEDILGIQVSQTPPASEPTTCEFNIYLYPISNPQAKKKTRIQYTAILHFSSSEQFVDNLKSASEWKTAILLQTQKAVKAAFCEVSEDSLEDSLHSSIDCEWGFFKCGY